MNKLKDIISAPLLAVSLSASIISFFLFSFSRSFGMSGSFSMEEILALIIFILGPVAYIFYKKFKEYKNNKYFFLSIIPGLIVIVAWLVNAF